jgi:hypothetical protein
MRGVTLAVVIALGFLAGQVSNPLVTRVSAHCDSMEGPVIPEARAALEGGDVTPVLKWIQSENEAEVRMAFAKAVAVRGQGVEARELADQYFLETLIRLHRAGEGAGYTGLKDEPAGPIVAMADKALADGSVDEMIERINAHLSEAIRERFARVVEVAKVKDKDVEAGREFVEAYVTYVHYVEGVQDAILSAGAHHAEPKPAKDPTGHEH